MSVQRMDHVGIVVGDLEAAMAFFVELGLEQRGDPMTVGGDWVGRIVGLEGARSRIVFLSTPDGHGQLELVKFLAPAAEPGDPGAPANARGIRHLTFAVDDVEDTVARLRAHGGELVGTIERYEDQYLLCYVRGPEGIILELAQQLR